jgi:hypothetical protein
MWNGHVQDSMAGLRECVSEESCIVSVNVDGGEGEPV